MQFLVFVNIVLGWAHPRLDYIDIGKMYLEIEIKWSSSCHNP